MKIQRTLSILTNNYCETENGDYSKNKTMYYVIDGQWDDKSSDYVPLPDVFNRPTIKETLEHLKNLAPFDVGVTCYIFAIKDLKGNEIVGCPYLLEG